MHSGTYLPTNQNVLFNYWNDYHSLASKQTEFLKLTLRVNKWASNIKNDSDEAANKNEGKESNRLNNVEKSFLSLKEPSNSNIIVIQNSPKAQWRKHSLYTVYNPMLFNRKQLWSVKRYVGGRQGPTTHSVRNITTKHQRSRSSRIKSTSVKLVPSKSEPVTQTWQQNSQRQVQS